MPRQMATFGDRLVFSNGIIILGVFACFLLILFHGDTHALIPLYAVGVFISFTLSQTGMVRRWLTKKGPHWRNEPGCKRRRRRHDRHWLPSSSASTKFTHGAWIVFLLILVLVCDVPFDPLTLQRRSPNRSRSRVITGLPLPRRNIVVDSHQRRQ